MDIIDETAAALGKRVGSRGSRNGAQTGTDDAQDAQDRASECGLRGSYPLRT
jgi:hypothetical protein